MDVNLAFIVQETGESSPIWIVYPSPHAAHHYEDGNLRILSFALLQIATVLDVVV